MGAAPYDARRFRTLEDVTVPAGSLALPAPDGTFVIRAVNNRLAATVTLTLDAEAQAELLRQLAEGEA